MMKKTYLWGALALVMVTLLGCPPGDDSTPDPISADGPVTPMGWTKGLEDFVIQAGDNPGTVKYKFSATDPAASSYKLYYVQGSKTKAKDIIDGSLYREVNPGSEFAEVSLSSANTLYSFVVVAESTGKTNATSGVKTATTKAAPAVPPGGKSLTVTGVQADVSYAMLYKDIDESPVAGAYKEGSKFTFIEMDDEGKPIFTKAWNGTGEFYIILGGEESQYVYTAGKTLSETQGPEKYNFTQTSSTIAWGQFKKWDYEVDPGSGDPFVLIVTGLPADKYFGASLLNDSYQPVAIGMFGNDGFAFYEPLSGQQLPDTDKPFKTPGSYNLALAEVDTSTTPPTPGDIYNYTKGQITVSADIAPVTVDWEDFRGPQFVLIVTDLPSDKYFGASLIDNSYQPVAVGSPVTGGFEFYEPMVIGSTPYPDPSKPFKTPGSYNLSLAEVDMSTTPPTPGDIYNYTKGQITISADIAPVTVDWEDFTVVTGP
jgi:hypothetical protein